MGLNRMHTGTLVRSRFGARFSEIPRVWGSFTFCPKTGLPGGESESIGCLV